MTSKLNIMACKAHLQEKVSTSRLLNGRNISLKRERAGQDLHIGITEAVNNIIEHNC